MYIYIYIYMYIYVCIYIYKYTYIYVYIYIYTCVYLYRCNCRISICWPSVSCLHLTKSCFTAQCNSCACFDLIPSTFSVPKKTELHSCQRRWICGSEKRLSRRTFHPHILKILVGSAPLRAHIHTLACRRIHKRTHENAHTHGLMDRCSTSRVLRCIVHVSDSL